MLIDSLLVKGAGLYPEFISMSRVHRRWLQKHNIDILASIADDAAEAATLQRNQNQSRFSFSAENVENVSFALRPAAANRVRTHV